MAIVIAILLALILVALMNSNGAAQDGVLNFIRIAFIAGFIVLNWLIFVSYFLISYFAYTDQKWYGLIGVILFAFAPLALMWFGREELKDFLKQENQKRVFKVLLISLLGVISFTSLGLIYQEYKKTSPYLSQVILWALLCVIGLILHFRASKYPHGWRDLLNPSNDDMDELYVAFEERNYQEYSRFSLVESSFDSIDQSEVSKLTNEHHENLQKSQEILDQNIAVIQSKRSMDDYVIQTFLWVFIAIAIDLCWFAYEYALTLDFVAGSPIWAVGIVIVLAIGVIAIVNDLIRMLK